MLKIGIVGAGGMGTVHYSNYRHLANCQVVGVVGSSDQTARQAKEWNIPLFPTITAMTDAVSVDVVDICTPTFRHREDVTESLSLGKHTIVEKPCALYHSDAKALFELSRAKGVHLYVAQVLQFTREAEVLRELVKNETYGKPLDAVFQRLAARPEWAEGGWLFDRKKSGLVPFDLHIHDLDLIVSLFGIPCSSQCDTCGIAPTNTPELYRFTYRYDGLNVVAEAGWLNASLPFTARWRVYFERAMVIYDGHTVTAYPHGEAPHIFDTSESIQIPTGINLPPTGWFYTELGHFLDCIDKDVDSPLVSEKQVLAVLALLEQIAQT